MTAFNKRALAWGVCLLLMGWALRVHQVAWGMPSYAGFDAHAPLASSQFVVHPDEYFYVAIPLEMHRAKTLNPRFFENPSLFIYINYALSGLAGLSNRLPEGELAQRQIAPFSAYVVGRALSALMSVVAVACVFGAVRGLFRAHLWGAIGAGALMSVSYTAVQHAHYATTSSLASGFVALCLWACVMSLASRRYALPMLFLACVASGLAMGSRYNAGAVGLSAFFVGVWIVRRNRALWWRVMLVWLAFPITFLLTSPFVLLDFQKFWAEFTFISSRFTQFLPNHVGVGLWYELRYLAVFGVGIPASVLAVFGVWALGKRGRVLAMLGAFAVPYALVVLNSAAAHIGDQLIVPFLPVVAVLVGAGLVMLLHRLKLGARYAVVLMLVVPCAVLSVQWLSHLQPDTRLVMQTWLEANLPPNARVHLVGAYNVPLENFTGDVGQSFGDFDGMPQTLANDYDVVVVSDALWWGILRRDNLPQAEKDLALAQYQAFEGLPMWFAVPRPRLWGDTVMTNNGVYWHNPQLVAYCLNRAMC